MNTCLRLIRLSRSQWRGMALAAGLGALTVGSGIALISTSAYLISAAALLPSVAALQVAIVGVRFFGVSRRVLRLVSALFWPSFRPRSHWQPGRRWDSSAWGFRPLPVRSGGRRAAPG